MKAVHVIVRGRVQGVGFRAYVEREAKARGLNGWVRNLPDGKVEVLVSGRDAAVERMLIALRVGPPLAQVVGITATPHDGSHPEGFKVLPTA